MDEPQPIPREAFHISWRYVDTPSWVKADSMFVVFTSDEQEALTRTREHAAERRADTPISITRIEHWRAVPGVPGCEVSTLDRVRFTYKRIARFMTVAANAAGEPSVSLFIDGTFQTYTLADLTARAFPQADESQAEAFIRLYRMLTPQSCDLVRRIVELLLREQDREQRK